jgi:hypothetical protein
MAMDAELRDFTRRALEKGFAREEIGKALQRAGWAEPDIAEALSNFAPVDFPIAVPRPRPYLSAREVFIYLVLFAALYFSAWSLGALLFEFVNRAFPDPLLNERLGAFSNDRVRWNIAALVVAFPLFLYTFRMVNRAIENDPTKRQSRPRKWLTYMTLFLAALTLTGDLVTLLYNALGGELTVRFLLKVLIIAAIAGGIFAYFLLDMRKEET